MSNPTVSQEEFRDHIRSIIEEDRDLVEHFSFQADFSESFTWSVGYSDLTEIIDIEHIDKILEEPEDYLKVIHEVLEEFNEGDEEVEFRLRDLPDSKIYEIREIRKDQIGRYIGVNGLVKRTTKVEGYIKKAIYKCSRCEAKSSVEVVNNKLEEPVECTGCGKSRNKTSFIRLDKESEKTNFMEVEIQEPPETLEGREQPQKLMIEIKGNILNDRSLKPGDHIKACGILRANQRSKKSPIVENYLDLKDFDKIDQEYQELELTEEEEKKIKELSEGPDIFDKITKSISPTIKGLEEVKEAITLQLFGGVRKKYPDNTPIRGDIHILLVGDPGTAKSQVLRYVSGLSPRGQFSSGKGSTAAGLTAAAVRESSPIDNKQSWTLKAGVLPLADGGIACIDEIEKTPEEVRHSIREALEQQLVDVNKAGINTQLNARCGLLAACNPKLGRFEPNESFRDQIVLDPPMLSRFDLIFKIPDIPEKKRDSEIARHMLKLRRGDFNWDHLIDQETLRLYIKKAKEIKPELTKKAEDKLHDYYVDMRQESGPEGVTITARQLEALSRLAEASARIRLSDKATVEDCERAIKIFDYYLRETLENDIDLVESNYTSEERGILGQIRKKFRELKEDYPEGIPEEVLIDQLDISGGQVKKELNRMRTKGQVWTPEKGKYKLNEGA